jgi:hypothetical protein
MALAVKIFEDNFTLKQPQWCWRPEWLTGHDSAFGLLMKFALLNALSARDIATRFLSRTCGRRTTMLRTLNVDLRDHRVFDLQAIASALRTDVATVAGAFLNSDSTFTDAGASTLKWCELCMAWGLHVPVTQMHMVTQCPIHNRPLLTRCTFCEEAIPFTLSARTFDSPFRCPSCQLDLATRLRNARSWIPRVREDQVARIGMMRKYVAGYATLTKASQPVPTITGHCTSLRMLPIEKQQSAEYLDFIRQVVAEVSSEQGQSCLPLTGISKARCGCHGSEESLYEHFSPSVIPTTFQTAEEMCVATMVYRAIRRRIWRQLGAHRSCVSSACRHIWWDMRGARTASFCAKAAAYIRWRMLWEGRGTPRYLDTGKHGEYYGILGWLQARPAPYPEDWAVDRKEWMLAHIFSSVCLASYDGLTKEGSNGGSADMIWDAQSTTPNALTHWVLANADSRGGDPTIFTPATALLGQMKPAKAAGDHHSWHVSKLDQIQR